MNMDLVFPEFASRETSVLQLIEVLYVSSYCHCPASPPPPPTIINFIGLYSMLGHNSSSHIFSTCMYFMCTKHDGG